MFAWLEKVLILLYGFSYLQILGSVVVGVSLYLAIKLWNGQLNWLVIRRLFTKKQKHLQSDPFEESWHNLIRSLQPSELAISRNNHNLRLLAVQVSSFRSSQPEENLSEKKKKNKKNKKKDEVISKKSNITCGPLDSALWFDSLEKLIETVPFSSPHRSVPLIGDILLTVLLPKEDLLIAYLLNLVTPTLVYIFEKPSTNTETQSLVCRELTRWLTALQDKENSGQSGNTAYPKALLWFLLEFNFFGKLVEELASLKISAPLLEAARREQADKVVCFYTAAKTAADLADDDVAWVRYHLLGLFERHTALFELLMKQKDFEVLHGLERPSREDLGEPLMPIPNID